MENEVSLKKVIFTTLVTVLIVLGFESLSLFLTFSDRLEIHKTLIHPIWVFPKAGLWFIWSVKTLISVLCISRAYLQEKGYPRTTTLMMWLAFFILDILWPIAFLWFQWPLVAAILVSLMLPALFVAMLMSFLCDKIAAWATLVFALLILTKALLHWEIYIFKISAL